MSVRVKYYGNGKSGKNALNLLQSKMEGTYQSQDWKFNHVHCTATGLGGDSNIHYEGAEWFDTERGCSGDVAVFSGNI